ncbi:hypothetical protein D3C86_1089890 [compost metagenome]
MRPCQADAHPDAGQRQTDRGQFQPTAGADVWRQHGQNHHADQDKERAGHDHAISAAPARPCTGDRTERPAGSHKGREIACHERRLMMQNLQEERHENLSACDRHGEQEHGRVERGDRCCRPKRPKGQKLQPGAPLHPDQQARQNDGCDDAENIPGQVGKGAAGRDRQHCGHQQGDLREGDRRSLGRPGIPLRQGHNRQQGE